MQGPGLDISSLMGNIMMPPAPPMSTTSLQPQTSIDEDDDISDIVSIQDDDDNGDDEVKEVKMPAAKGRKGRKKKVEINL
jgi:hypothetical protein